MVLLFKNAGLQKTQFSSVSGTDSWIFNFREQIKNELELSESVVELNFSFFDYALKNYLFFRVRDFITCTDFGKKDLHGLRLGRFARIYVLPDK